MAQNIWKNLGHFSCVKSVTLILESINISNKDELKGNHWETGKH